MVSEDMIVGFVAVMMFVCLYVFVIKGVKTKKQRQYIKAKNNGWVTKGKAIGHQYLPRSDTHDNEMCVVKYEYFVDEKRYKKSLVYEDHGTSFIDFPDEIDLYYLKSNPSIVFSDGYEKSSEARQKSVGCLLCIVIPGILGALAMKIFGHL